MGIFVDDFENLRQNGITKTAFKRFGDPNVVPLWFGEGDIPTPQIIRKAAQQALDDGATFYTHTLGSRELRIAIQQYIENQLDTPTDLERICVPGSSMLAVNIAVHMTLSKNDHAIVISPHWPNVDRAMSVVGADITYVRQDLTDCKWQLSLEKVFDAVTDTTRVIYLNSPSNPTGWTMSAEDQNALLTFCREKQIVILADEVYNRVTFELDAAPSFLEITEPEDPVIVVNGFSKAYAMTGWRLGWLVAPKGYQEQLAVVSECFNTSAPSFIQQAGVAALTKGEPIIKDLRERYKAGRTLVMDAFQSHSRIQIAEPEGAFYVFPKIDSINSSEHFTNTVLEKLNIGLAPGYTFGPKNEQHFRLCFAQSHDKLKVALQKIVDFIHEY